MSAVETSAESLATSRPPPVRHWWQFTLREILLAMTAAGALVALAVKSYPSPPTPFFGEFDAQTQLKQVMANLSIKPRSSGGGTSSSWDGGSGHKRWHFCSGRGDRQLGAVGFVFAQRVESELARHDCQIHGRSWSGNPKQQSLNSFGYSYRRGATQGEFAAEFVDLGNGFFKMHAFCYEFTNR
jgi:hypothetical protein